MRIKYFFSHFRLDELDRLAEIGQPETPKVKSHFCEFREPHSSREEELFNRTISKTFLVPCAELKEKVPTKTRREVVKMCEVSR